MHKKLTITLDEDIYEGLHRVIGRRKISGFIEDLVRPHVTGKGLEAAYHEQALYEASDREAQEWAEGLIGDVGALLD